MLIIENDERRVIRSEEYNSILDKKTGMFARWGKTEKEDCLMAPMPELADIEISSGMCHNSCPFCYKSNTACGELHNMTFEQFRNVFHKLANTVVEISFKDDHPKIIERVSAELNTTYKDCYTKQAIIDKTLEFYAVQEIDYIKVINHGLLNQIAFGITSPNDNPDFFRMMEYAREFDVMPNYTINGTDMTEEIADKTVKLCGACAVSVCSDMEKSSKAVRMLLDRGFKQTNIHVVAMTSTFEKIKQLINDCEPGKPLEGLNAIVLLRYKPKGTNAGKFSGLSLEQYREIFHLALDKQVGIGFDSCSAPVFLKSIEGQADLAHLAVLAEPCESTLFSIYINSFCEVAPCSFTENETREWADWKQGINVLECNDFYKDIWYNPRIVEFRGRLLANGRKCPMFNLEN